MKALLKTEIKVWFVQLRVNENSAVVILKNFDEGLNILPGREITPETIQNFISRNSEPLIINFNKENAKTIFHGFEKSPNVLLFTRDDVEITEEIRNVATSLRGEFRFVSINMNLDDNFRLLEFLGITNRGGHTKTLKILTFYILFYRFLFSLFKIINW